MELNQLKEQIQEKLLTKGYELVSLSFRNEKGSSTLSLVVDRVEPIDMDAITEISRYLNEVLDVIDPFENPYTLDISSLGAEKPLKIENLNSYLNNYVHVHMINPIKGENIYEGTLTKVDNDSITLSYKNKTRVLTVDIEKSNISKIRLAIKF